MTQKRHQFHNKRNEIVVMIVVGLAVITASFMMNIINPTIDQISISEVENKISRIIYQETKSIVQNYRYEDFVTVKLDGDQNVSMIQINPNIINSVSSEIVSKIIEQAKKNENSQIKIYMGSLFGIPLFSGTGPKIHTSIASVSNVNTDFKSEFISTGINQTLHQINLEIRTRVSIVTPYHSISTNTQNTVVLAESIIVGKVPSSYYHTNNENPMDNWKEEKDHSHDIDK